MVRRKTVYILGAGFSDPAGGPNQARLLRYIFNLPDRQPGVRSGKRALRRFLIEVLNVAPSGVNDVLLEDIYTPIDRCLADGVALRNKSPADLQIVRGQMEYLIALAIDRCFRSTSPRAKQYALEFARSVVAKTSRRAELAIGTDSADAAKKYDPLSIISLNWDILLDRCLYEELSKQDCGRRGDYDPVGVVDYCCYISSVDPTDKRVRPGFWTLGARGYNVKLLKIHGSMNWLQCSNCQRLFVAFDGKLNVPNFVNPRRCRHCGKYRIRAALEAHS